jgi:hypothetical protein
MSKSNKHKLYRQHSYSSFCQQTNFNPRYKHERNRKKIKIDEEDFVDRKPQFKKGMNNHFDYTPLFKFLHSKVGQKFDEVFSEAKSRLDKTEPIFWIVQKELDLERAIARVGENSCYHTMYVDEQGLLQFVDKTAKLADELYSVWKYTRTLNGKTA